MEAGEVVFETRAQYCTNNPNNDHVFSLPNYSPSFIDALLDVTVSAEFSRGWTGETVYDHLATLSLNNTPVGSAIVPGQSRIEGTLSPTALVMSGPRPRQVLNVRSDHTNEAHFTVASDFQMTLNFGPHVQTQCFSPEETQMMAFQENVMCPESSTPPATCSATIILKRDDTQLYVRSGPGTNFSNIGGLTQGQTIEVTGQYVSNSNWHRIRLADGSVGWVGDPAALSFDPACSYVPAIDEQGAIITTEFDYELPLPDDAWLQLTCTDEPSIANWQNCAKIVYHHYFYQFQDENNNNSPYMSDLLAGVYRNELFDAHSSNAVNGIHSRAGISSRDIASEALRRNYWSVVYTENPGCDNPIDCRLNAEEITEKYLVQVQSWYGKANLGEPKSGDIELLLNRRLLSVAVIALSQQWQACGGGRPCQWGNYGFGTVDYEDVQASDTVAYCHLVQRFTEADGDPNNAIHNPHADPTDTWTDYKFAIITEVSYGTTSTYDYAHRPPWLNNDQTAVDERGQIVYKRLTVGGFKPCS